MAAARRVPQEGSQRRTGAADRQGIGILFRGGRHHHGDDLSLVREPIGKQRTYRAIDQPAGENFFFGGTSLTFDKSARNLAGGVSVFAIIYRERKKRGSRFGLIGHASGDENNRVTGTNDNSAVRLLGHSAGFKCNNQAAQVNFNCMVHNLSKNLQPRPGTAR